MTSTGQTTNPYLPGWRRNQLDALLAAVEDTPMSDDERHALVWLSGWEAHIVAAIAAVIAHRGQPPALAGDSCGRLPRLRKVRN